MQLARRFERRRSTAPRRDVGGTGSALPSRKLAWPQSPSRRSNLLHRTIPMEATTRRVFASSSRRLLRVLRVFLQESHRPGPPALQGHSIGAVGEYGWRPEVDGVADLGITGVHAKPSQAKLLSTRAWTQRTWHGRDESHCRGPRKKYGVERNSDFESQVSESAAVKRSNQSNSLPQHSMSKQLQ